jgi:hypothetical protein
VPAAEPAAEPAPPGWLSSLLLLLLDPLAAALLASGSKLRSKNWAMVTRAGSPYLSHITCHIPASLFTHSFAA